MPDRISKVQRWLDLISFLVGRRFPVDVDQVMRHVPAYAERWTEGSETERASVRRMFERDKDELRELGIPLETVEYSVDFGVERSEGYRLAREDFYLPYLRLLGEAGEAGQDTAGSAPSGAFELAEDEAALALDALDRVLERDAFPLREDARAARRKLTFDLDPGALDAAPVLWVDPPGAGRRAETLDTLSDALLRRKRVRFAYHGIHRGQRTERTVEPWGLLFQHTHWYLVGRDLDRDERRTFRVARMEALEVAHRGRSTPDYEIPDDFDLAALRDREAWELGDDEPLEARVRFRFPRSLWAERNDMGRLESSEDDGAQVRTFRVSQTDPFLRWVLSLAGDARVVAPPELVRAFREMAGRVAGLYQDDAAAGTPSDAGTDAAAGDADG